MGQYARCMSKKWWEYFMELLKKILPIIICIVTLIIGVLIGNHIKQGKGKDNHLEGVYESTEKVEEIIAREGDKIITNDSGNKFYLIFNNDFTFYSIMDEKVEKGRYYLTDDETKFFLEFEERSGCDCTLENNLLKCNLYANYTKVK